MANMNIRPYYDDFDDSKNFYRILFRPSFSLQARELTQSQTLFYDQLEKVSSLSDGDKISSGEIVYDNGTILLSSGVYYVNGMAVNVSAKKLENVENGKVGFVVLESFVTPEEDESLYDNAYGTPNFLAPGSHRYKVELQFTSRDLGYASTDNFLEVFRVVNKKVQRSVPDIETDSFVIEDFDIDIQESSDKNSYVIGLRNGSVSVNGMESEIDYLPVTIPKPRRDSTQPKTDEITLSNISTFGNSGEYVVVNYYNTNLSAAWADLLNLSVSTTLTFKRKGINKEVTTGSAVVSDVVPTKPNELRIYLTNITMEDGYSIIQEDEIHLGSLFIGYVSQAVVSDKIYPIFELSEKNLSASQATDPTVTFRKYRDSVTLQLGTNGVTVLYSTLGVTSLSEDDLDRILLYGEGKIYDSSSLILTVVGDNSLQITLASGDFPAATGNSYTLLYDKEFVDVSVARTQYTKSSTDGYLQQTTSNYALDGLQSHKFSHGLIIASSLEVYMAPTFTGSIKDDSWIDVTERYGVDDGQRDYTIEKGGIFLREGYSVNTGSLYFKYDYWNAGTCKRYAIASSYVGGTYEEIPSYDGLKLSDCIDLRLHYNSTDLPIPTSGRVDIEQARVFGDRIDKIILKKDGQISVIEGSPFVNNDLVPADEKDSLTLYKVYLDGYGHDLTDIAVTKSVKQTLSTSDLVSLEERISRLELDEKFSKLENEALGKSFSGGLEIEGLVVDGFEGHNVGQTKDIDYMIGVDYEKGEMTTPTTSRYTTMTLDGLAAGQNTITLDSQTEVLDISNSKGTDSISINELGIFNGYMEISPYLDVTKGNDSREQTPFNIGGHFDNIVNIQDTSKTTDTIANDWELFWFGKDEINSPVLETINRDGKKMATNYRPYRNHKVVDITVTGLKPTVDHKVYIDDTPVIDYSNNGLGNLVSTGSYIAQHFTAEDGVTEFSHVLFYNAASDGSITGADGPDSTGRISGKLYIPAGLVGKATIEVKSDDGVSKSVGNYYNQGLGRPDRTCGIGSSISQEFEVFEDTFFTTLDLYFSQKDETLPVQVQLRKMINGSPSDKVIFSKEILPTSINTIGKTSVEIASKNGGTYYQNLQVLKRGKYCITVLTGSTETKLYGSNTQSSDIDVGRFFRNGSEVKNFALKFELYRADFLSQNSTFTIKTDKFNVKVDKMFVNPVQENQMVLFENGMGYTNQSVNVNVNSLPYRIERVTFGIINEQVGNNTVAKPNILDGGIIKPNSLVMFAKSVSATESDVWGYTLNEVDFTKDTATPTLDIAIISGTFIDKPVDATATPAELGMIITTDRVVAQLQISADNKVVAETPATENTHVGGISSEKLSGVKTMVKSTNTSVIVSDAQQKSRYSSFETDMDMEIVDFIPQVDMVYINSDQHIPYGTGVLWTDSSGIPIEPNTTNSYFGVNANQYTFNIELSHDSTNSRVSPLVYLDTLTTVLIANDLNDPQYNDDPIFRELLYEFPSQNNAGITLDPVSGLIPSNFMDGSNYIQFGWMENPEKLKFSNKLSLNDVISISDDNELEVLLKIKEIVYRQKPDATTTGGELTTVPVIDYMRLESLNGGEIDTKAQRLKTSSYYKIYKYGGTTSDEFMDSTSVAKYISSSINLTNPANAISVEFDGNVSGGNRFEVYYRTDGNASFSKVDFYSYAGQVVFGGRFPSGGTSGYESFSFRKTGIFDTFESVQVKIVLKGSDTKRPPKIKNLKIYALDDGQREPAPEVKYIPVSGSNLTISQPTLNKIVPEQGSIDINLADYVSGGNPASGSSGTYYTYAIDASSSSDAVSYSIVNDSVLTITDKTNVHDQFTDTIVVNVSDQDTTTTMTINVIVKYTEFMLGEEKRSVILWPHDSTNDSELSLKLQNVLPKIGSYDIDWSKLISDTYVHGTAQEAIDLGLGYSISSAAGIPLQCNLKNPVVNTDVSSDGWQWDFVLYGTIGVRYKVRLIIPIEIESEPVPPEEYESIEYSSQSNKDYFNSF